MPGNLAYQAYQLIWIGLDWLYPPVCGGCGKNWIRWCEVCQSKSQLIGNQVCTVCGDLTSLGGICTRCQENKPFYSAVRSWAVYEGCVRSALHKLKYKGDIGLGDSLAKPMLADLKRIGWQIDIVAPVPLSLARLAKRGYNQAALIACPIALGLQLPYRPKAIRRVRDTRSQVGLSTDERRMNVHAAFSAQKDVVSGKRVLIVDDVTTTGSTLNECAASLLSAGAQEVYGYTLARPPFLGNLIEMPGKLDIV
jgi:ComF family protein